MTPEQQAMANEALQAVGELTPLIAATSPQGAAIVALAPLAIKFLQSAMQLQQAGAMTAEQLVGLFATIGQGVQSSHAQWAAMNAADAQVTASITT